MTLLNVYTFEIETDDTILSRRSSTKCEAYLLHISYWNGTSKVVLLKHKVLEWVVVHPPTLFMCNFKKCWHVGGLKKRRSGGGGWQFKVKDTWNPLGLWMDNSDVMFVGFDVSNMHTHNLLQMTHYINFDSNNWPFNNIFGIAKEELFSSYALYHWENNQI